MQPGGGLGAPAGIDMSGSGFKIFNQVRIKADKFGLPEESIRWFDDQAEKRASLVDKKAIFG